VNSNSSWAELQSTAATKPSDRYALRICTFLSSAEWTCYNPSISRSQ
jgi:hypothetical protein